MKKILLILSLFLSVTIYGQGLFYGHNFTEATAGGNIVFRSDESGSNASTTSVSITKPSGVVSGDLLVIYFTTSTFSSPMTAPSGWTKVTTDIIGAFETFCYYKEAGSSEPSSYSFTSTNSTSWSWVSCAFYDDGGTGTWTLEDSSELYQGTASNTITTNAVDTEDNSLLICGFGNDDDETVSTAPADMTEIAYITGGSGYSTSVLYYENTDLESSVTKSITFGGSAEQLSAVALVFTHSI